MLNKLGRPVDYYNLANVKGALGEVALAEAHYRRCLELNPNCAQAWHNLGSLLVKAGRESDGIKCLDHALQLKPNMLEAIITKANVLVKDSDNCSEALHLMERAFVLAPDLENRWSYAHYWKAIALCRLDRFVDALAIVEDRLERKFDCPYLGRLATDILAKLWRSDPSYVQKSEHFFRMRIDSKQRDHRVLIEILDLLDATGRSDEAWRLFDDFLGTHEVPIKSIADRVPLSIADLTDSLASIEYYRRYRKASELVDYAILLDKYGLRPHDDVPEILFYLLLPAYRKLACALQDSNSRSESNREIEVLIETYQLISGVFAAFGGALLSSRTPETTEEQADLLARAVLVGQDIPLMEISRLLGYLCGIANREVPDNYRETTVEFTSIIYDRWLKGFFEAVGFDWEINSLSK